MMVKGYCSTEYHYCTWCLTSVTVIQSYYNFSVCLLKYIIIYYYYYEYMKYIVLSSVLFFLQANSQEEKERILALRKERISLHHGEPLPPGTKGYLPLHCPESSNFEVQAGLVLCGLFYHDFTY